MNELGGHYVKWNQSDSERNTAWSHSYVKSKNVKLTETESKIVVGQGWSGEKWGDAS